MTVCACDNLQLTVIGLCSCRLISSYLLDSYALSTIPVSDIFTSRLSGPIRLSHTTHFIHYRYFHLFYHLNSLHKASFVPPNTVISKWAALTNRLSMLPTSPVFPFFPRVFHLTRSDSSFFNLFSSLLCQTMSVPFQQEPNLSEWVWTELRDLLTGRKLEAND